MLFLSVLNNFIISMRALIMCRKEGALDCMCAQLLPSSNTYYPEYGKIYRIELRPRSSISAIHRWTSCWQSWPVCKHFYNPTCCGRPLLYKLGPRQFVLQWENYHEYEILYKNEGSIWESTQYGDKLTVKWPPTPRCATPRKIKCNVCSGFLSPSAIVAKEKQLLLSFKLLFKIDRKMAHCIYSKYF